MDKMKFDQNTRHKEFGFVPIVGVVIILIIIAVGIYFFSAKIWPKDDNIPSSTVQTSSNQPHQQVMQSAVKIDSTGFVPQVVTVQKGTVVIWTNTDKAPHEVASDPHPTHTGLPGLESTSLLTNDSYSFTFDKTGTFAYHDHFNPFKLNGTIIVQ